MLDGTLTLCFPVGRILALRPSFEPILDDLDEVVAAKAEDGGPQLGTLAPLLERQIAYYRGIPDYTSQAMYGTVQNALDTINSGIKKVNKILPDNHQLEETDMSPREAMDKFISFQYAGGIALKPAVLIRDALKIFTTAYPVLGNYTWKGMAKAFGAIKSGVESDAWKIAQEAGALLERREIKTLIAGGQEEVSAIENWAEKAMRATQVTDNAVRLVSFWGHKIKVTDALENFLRTRDADAFTKESTAWFMNPGMRKKYLDMLPRLTEDGVDSFSTKMAADLTGLDQWNYHVGAQPGVYKYTLGRLFGMYGTWPLNYIEYGRRCPAAWTGGPITQTALNMPAIGSGGKQGQDARDNLKRMLLWPGFVPGGQELEDLHKAISNNENGWIYAMGFQPVKGKKE
jgi:hypothetical protein